VKLTDHKGNRVVEKNPGGACEQRRGGDVHSVELFQHQVGDMVFKFCR